MSEKATIEEFLQKLAKFADNDYANAIRSNFKDNLGLSELGMLAAPTSREFEQLKRGVAIMTQDEKQNAENLTDEEIQRIASDAKIDPADFAIFINGYTLYLRGTSKV